MMRRDTKHSGDVDADQDGDCGLEGYFTYRPLSNLPTPPPSSRNSSAAQSPRTTLNDGEPLMARFRGESRFIWLSGYLAVHLINKPVYAASLSLLLPCAVSLRV